MWNYFLFGDMFHRWLFCQGGQQPYLYFFFFFCCFENDCRDSALCFLHHITDFSEVLLENKVVYKSIGVLLLLYLIFLHYILLYLNNQDHILHKLSSDI